MIASDQEIAQAMAHIGILDGYDNMKRLGEFLCFNEYWFNWIEEQKDRLELEAIDQATKRGGEY